MRITSTFVLTSKLVTELSFHLICKIQTDFKCYDLALKFSQKKKFFIARACCVQDMHIDIYINYASRDYFLCISTSSYVLFCRFQSVSIRKKSNRFEISMVWFLDKRFGSVWNQNPKSNRTIWFETESFRDVQMINNLSKIEISVINESNALKTIKCQICALFKIHKLV